MDPETRALNQAVYERLFSDDPTLQKEAQTALSDYVRTHVREDAFVRKILDPVVLRPEDYDRVPGSDNPAYIGELEQTSPGAITIGYGGLPNNLYIKGRRFVIEGARIVGPRFTKDVIQLGTYRMDIRQVLSDHAIKDILEEEDGQFIELCNSLLQGAGVTVPETGTVQWRQIAGGITRDSLAEAMKTLGSTPNRLTTATVLVNNNTVWDIVKFDRTEVGGDLSEEMIIQGFQSRKFMNANWIVTNKQDLVPDNTIFLFAAPKFIGKFVIFEDTQLYIHRDAYLLEFFPYECVGGAIANVAGIGRVDFT